MRHSLSSLLLIITILLIVSCQGTTDSDVAPTSPTPSPTCIDTNCSDYYSQAAAQAAYDADPECRGDLDADNDGIACEEPGNSVTICPTTANCGCSNKNKSPCQADPCCRWIVGTGCKCR
ncbi:MAG: excalibur calcium-binding domain-containing protein [Cyclobacteriaceae bacterium]